MKMKTIIPALLAALVWGLGSCAPETVEWGGGTNTSVPVGFAARSVTSLEEGGVTRGEVIADASGLAAGGGFDVWTYHHAGEWATTADAELLVDGAASVPGGPDDHAHVESDDDGDNWSYGPQPVFWPEGRSVSSFALAPKDAPGVAVTPSTGETPSVAITLPVPGPARVDLMFAKALTDLTASGSGGRITERFSHALARVNFLAFKSTSLAGSEVVVTAIRFVDIYESGTAQLTTPAVWTTTGQPQTIEFTTANSRLAGGEIAAPAAEDAHHLLSTAVGELFVLPQPLAKEQLEISYTIDGVEKTKSMSALTETTALAAGHTYTCIVGIKGDVADDPVVIDDGGGDVEITADGYYYIEAWGGDGGDGAGGGGAGGVAQKTATVYLTGNDNADFDISKDIQIFLGTAGAHGVAGAGGAGGTNGTPFGDGGSGGNGGPEGGGGGGGGGAATLIMLGTASALSDVELVAGGAGGGGGRMAQPVSGGAGNGGNSGGGTAQTSDGVQPADATGNYAGPGGKLWYRPWGWELPPWNNSPEYNNKIGGDGQNGTCGNGGGGGGGGTGIGALSPGSGGGSGTATTTGSGGNGGGGAGAGSGYVWMGGKTPPAGVTLPDNQRPAGMRDGYVIITYLGPAE